MQRILEENEEEEKRNNINTWLTQEKRRKKKGGKQTIEIGPKEAEGSTIASILRNMRQQIDMERIT